MTRADLEAIPAAFVPPRIAAQVLGCDQYSLNLQAKQAQAEGRTRIGCIRFFFSGRNLKLCKLDILECMGA